MIPQKLEAVVDGTAIQPEVSVDTELMLSVPNSSNNYHREHVLIMLENLKRWANYDLIKEYGFSGETLGEQVFNADFYLLSHNTATDPVLTYGNQQVLDRWELSWQELTTMHSRDTAKPVDRSQRSKLMAQVKMDNYITGYSGIRVSKTGKEFQILDGIIWNLFLSDGSFYGQAAWFKLVKCHDSF
jgi:MEKHLA domain